MTREDDVIEALIETQGQLYSEEIGADIARDTPQEWFHWLLGVQLMSARIDAAHAVQAARALRDEGLHKVDAILQGGRSRRVAVLNGNGYARFDNRGADQMQEAAEQVDRAYGGDLRRLRDAGGDADGIARELQGIKGIGPKGAQIFCREAQIAWDALFPMIDDASAAQAQDLGLPADATTLARHAGTRERHVRLVAALTRASLDGPSDRVKDVA